VEFVWVDIILENSPTRNLAIGMSPKLISNDELLALTLHDISPAHWALHALDLHLCETHSSQSQFYAMLSGNEGHELCGHMDGGAQASTTNHLEYLFHYQLLGNNSATLKVADNTPHYPFGLGFSPCHC